MSKSEQTTDHKTIRSWAEKHHGVPSKVSTQGAREGEGILRISFPETRQSQSDDLEEISWDEFFTIFEDSKLALLYETEKDSNFNKLVSREA